MSQPSTENRTKHDLASAAYLQGNYREAIRHQVEVVNEQLKAGKQAVTSRKLLSLYLYNAKEYDPAITLLKSLSAEFPEDAEIPENIGVMLRQSGRTADFEAADEYFGKTVTRKWILKLRGKHFTEERKKGGRQKGQKQPI